MAMVMAMATATANGDSSEEKETMTTAMATARINQKVMAMWNNITIHNLPAVTPMKTLLRRRRQLSRRGHVVSVGIGVGLIVFVVRVGLIVVVVRRCGCRRPLLLLHQLEWLADRA